MAVLALTVREQLPPIVAQELDQLVTRLQRELTSLTQWVNPTPILTDFGSDLGQTWTITLQMIQNWQYLKSGTVMEVAFDINGTTVGGTPHSHIDMRIPGNFICKRQRREMIYLTDNGVRVDGMVFIRAGSAKMEVYRADLANFTGGVTAVGGSIRFETTL